MGEVLVYMFFGWPYKAKGGTAEGGFRFIFGLPG